MSDMADVLREHELAIDYAEYFACTCGTIQSTTNGHHPEHVAAALSAAGFGPVQEARAEAFEQGQKSGFWNGRLSQLTVPYNAPDPLIGKQHADATNPYREDT